MSHRGQCYGVGTVPNIKLDGHQSATYWRIRIPFVSCPQEGSGNNYTKFCVNLPNWCGDIKYLNLKCATLWSSPKILQRPSGAHVKVVSSVSCQPNTPLSRYATLPVWNQICRKLLFHNLKITFSITSLLITFCQEGPQMLCAKFRGNWKSCFLAFCELYLEIHRSSLNAWI